MAYWPVIKGVDTGEPDVLKGTSPVRLEVVRNVLPLQCWNRRNKYPSLTLIVRQKRPDYRPNLVGPWFESRWAHLNPRMLSATPFMAHPQIKCACLLEM